MSNTQYAVCHLQRGSGNDSGMSCHIERKDGKGKVYVPDNADANRTQLNRELIAFPAGVKNRTDAIQYRINNAGLHRKLAKNQTKAIRIILTGTHEQMMKIAQEGKLGNWIDANLKWLRETFGSENLVSCVLHMDEKTPHLHATVVPIVTTERLRKKREGEKKYETKSGPRLSADDVMRRSKLHEYQNSYAAAMKSFGLQRGIVGSTARHQANSEYYKQQISRYEEDITKLQVDIEKAQEGKNTILSWFGKGDLAKAKKELAEKDELIAKLKDRIRTLKAEKAQLQERHKSEMERLRNDYQKEIDKAIRRAETAERQSKEKDAVIDKQKQHIDQLDRKANPHRYQLSSGAELVHYIIPNMRNPSIHIWTKVGNEEYDTRTYIEYFSDIWERFSKDEATVYELINEVFEPQEQVNEAQANLLGAAFELVAGGQAQVHVGTGSGGSSSELPWNNKDKYSNKQTTTRR
ncbi:recombinase [Parabacteroides merdae]|uniref:Recombinase n=2 Tax=Bacteroidales TaxID=171549 RepID=A0A9Q4WTY8_9BACT|nr:MobV family relaxase [Parabacteroides merdae]MRX88908.1 recombinase [Parabacteroides merdae]MTT10244.1 recombinase [Parabacteroides merdae]MTT14155.1 recombinase [Parabacteroides merdae]MTT43196.1 recombinase [Parabacteroides merdae]MTT59024.1 recombinase [Parabacteroides merdae]